MTFTIQFDKFLISENVALGKPASQSGNYYAYSTADKAVDGNTIGSMEAQSCVHPDTRHSTAAEEDKNQTAWWRVDLEQSYDVYQVLIYNRDFLRSNYFQILYLSNFGLIRHRLAHYSVVCRHYHCPASPVHNPFGHMFEHEKFIFRRMCNYAYEVHRLCSLYPARIDRS